MKLHQIDNFLIVNNNTGTTKLFKELETLTEFIFKEMEKHYSFEKLEELVLDSVREIEYKDNVSELTYWLDLLELQLYKASKIRG